MKIGRAGFSSRVPTGTIAHSAPSGLFRQAPPKRPSARPRAPSVDPPEFLLPPSPPVFNVVPTAAKKDSSKPYRLAYISSSCPDVSNFIPMFAPVIEDANLQKVHPMPTQQPLSTTSQHHLRPVAQNVPLGSSPTIMSVLQTTPLSGSESLEKVAPTPVTTQDPSPKTFVLDSPSPVPHEDDDLMFGPLSLGPDGGFLDGLHESSENMSMFSL